MNDSGGVRFSQRIERLQRKIDRRGHGHPSSRCQPVGEIDAIQVFHHDVRYGAFELADLEDPRHVLAANPCHRSSFPPEARQEFGV
jgi:hypothetical protein